MVLWHLAILFRSQQPSQSWKWTVEAKKSFAEMLAIEGMNPWEYLSFSSGDLKKIGWSDEIIAQYAESKISYSIRSKKSKNKCLFIL